MKRRIAILAVASLLGGAASMLQVSPASAANETCAGVGTATTGAALGLEASGAVLVDTTFGFTLNVGACTVSASVTADGNVKGFCGDSTGSGTANGHHDFTFVGTGSVLVLSGGVEGAVNATPDTANGHSCVGNNASQFVISGEAQLS